MARIALLGLGSMGRRMARRLVAAKHDLAVWSRSGLPDEVAELQPHWRATARDAVADADFAISMVTDDNASRQIWLDGRAGALAACPRDTLIIESSTISASWATELSALTAAVGARFLDAPVVGSRPQAEAGALVYLVGGAAGDVARATPVLAAMGSAVHPLGPTPNATIAKLAVNTLFSAQVATLGELLGVVERSGLEVAALLDLLATLPVLSPAAKVAATAIHAARYQPMFPIALVAKDLRYALASATALGAEAPLTERLAEIFEAAMARGLGADNITAVARIYQRGT
jgi:3-hydroxyisobutyrate dehydrogenase